MRRWAALMFLLAGCQASSLDLGVILPRDGAAFLERVECYRLTATRGGETFEDVSRDRYSLNVRGLPAGRYEVTLEAVEHPIDELACTGGDVRARALTRDAWIAPDRVEPVPLVLLPYDRPVALDVPAWVEDWFEGRTDLVGVTALDADGTPRVIFAGGQIDGRPSAEVLSYEPRVARFSTLPDLACAREGAAAVAVGAPGEDQQVLIAGGEGDCTVPPAPDATAYEAVYSSELLDLHAGTTTLAPLPVPAERPRMLRDEADASGNTGGGAWLLAGRDEFAIDVFWNGETWTQDPQPDPLLPFSGGAFTPIHPDGRPPFLTAGGRAGGRLLETLSLVEPVYEKPGLTGCSIATTTAPVAGDHVAAAPSGDGDVLLTGNAADGGAKWFRQEIDDNPCGVRPGYASGPLAVRRETPRATGLGDGRVLLSGGDPEGSLETYLPERGGTLHLGTAGGRREGHATVILEDGSVFIAGGGPRTVNALLPRPDAPSVLDWDHNADLDPELDVIVIVSSHEEARDVRALLASGGYFDPVSGFLPGGAGPGGLAEATRPLLQVEFQNDREVRIVVTTGNLRCGPGVRLGDGGEAESCSDPERQDTTANELTCTLDSIEEDDACVAQELLGALEQMIANDEDDFEPHPDRPLLVLIAAPRDDCSSSSGALFASETGTLLERCADAEDLLDPVEVADLLGRWHGDPSLVSVMTFGGPAEPVVGDPPEACRGIRPTPRLAALSSAMGARGRHIDLCQAGPRSGGARSPTALEAWSSLVDGRIGRKVCLPHAPLSFAPPSCLVTYEREVAPGVHESLRLPEGAEGWLVEPVEQNPDVPPDAQCSTAILSVSQRLELPIGVPVSYACQ